MVSYFIRDDDVGELTAALRVFIETFATRGLPVSYQIIPALLTDECAEYLLAIERQYPQLVEFGQHGLRHEMHLRGRRLLREFGPERSREQQQADIVEGLALLKARLGENRTIEVFTPPQHKYDANTVIAAAAAGHRVFSAAYYPSTRHQLAYALGRRLRRSSIWHHGISYNGHSRPEAAIDEVSIAVDVDDGEVIRYGADAIPAIAARAQRYTQTIGFMFHHDMYGDPSGRMTLIGIADQLAAFGKQNFSRLGALGAGAGRAA